MTLAFDGFYFTSSGPAPETRKAFEVYKSFIGRPDLTPEQHEKERAESIKKIAEMHRRAKEEEEMFCKKCEKLHYQYDILQSKESWLKWCSKEGITPCKCEN